MVNNLDESSVDNYKPYAQNGKLTFEPHISNVTSEMAKLAFDNGFDFKCWTMESGYYGFDTHEEFINACYNAIQCGVTGITCDNHTIYDIVREKLNLIS